MSLPKAFVAGPTEGETFKAGPFDIVSRVQGGQSNGVFELYELALGKATIDYGFHLIVTDLPDQRIPELKGLIDQGVSSFKKGLSEAEDLTKPTAAQIPPPAPTPVSAPPEAVRTPEEETAARRDPGG